MVYSQTLQLAPPRIRVELRRVLICLAAATIALTGAALAPGNAYANQTYPAAVGHSIIADGALPVATPVPLPLGTRYLARKTVERIAKDDIGKLHGLRIGPFAPGAASRAMPLGWAEPLIGHPLPAGADRATPVWVVTVDAPPKANVLGDPTTAEVFTDLINAVSGAVIDTCSGCRTVRD
jgi:hypothetical protein